MATRLSAAGAPACRGQPRHRHRRLDHSLRWQAAHSGSWCARHSCIRPRRRTARRRCNRTSPPDGRTDCLRRGLRCRGCRGHTGCCRCSIGQAPCVRNPRDDRRRPCRGCCRHTVGQLRRVLSRPAQGRLWFPAALPCAPAPDSSSRSRWSVLGASAPGEHRNQISAARPCPPRRRSRSW